MDSHQQQQHQFTEREAKVNRLKVSYKIPPEYREISDSRFIYMRASQYAGQSRIDLRMFKLNYEIDQGGFSPLRPTMKGLSLTVSEAIRLCKELTALLLEQGMPVAEPLLDIVKRSKAASVGEQKSMVIKTREFVHARPNHDPDDELEESGETVPLEVEDPPVSTPAPPPIKRARKMPAKKTAGDETVA